MRRCPGCSSTDVVLEDDVMGLLLWACQACLRKWATH